MPVVAALLLGLAPWRVTAASWTRRTTGSAAATVIAALAASAATLVVIGERPGRGARRPGWRWSWRAARGCSCWPSGSSCSSGRTGMSSGYGGSPAGACGIWPAGPATSCWSAIWTARSGTRARRSRTTATSPERWPAGGCSISSTRRTGRAALASVRLALGGYDRRGAGRAPRRVSRPKGPRDPAGSRSGSGPPTGPGGTSSPPCCATRRPVSRSRCSSPPATSATRSRCASRSPT